MEGSVKILVVDDEELIRGLLPELIKRLFPESETIVCDGVKAAIQALQESSFDVVITDWNMAAGGGEAVVRAAKDAGIPDNKIFVITGSGVSPEEARENLEQAGKLTIGGCLLKPFHIEQFKELLS